MKNSEARIKRFCKIAQPHIYVRFRGIGERPNKQENVGFRESGNPALFVKWVPLCIACQDAPGYKTKAPMCWQFTCHVH